MADQILMSNIAGFVTSANPNGGYCEIQQFGNFPRSGQAPDEPGNDFEESVRAGFTFSGTFLCKGYFLSEGQQVRFDIALGPINDSTGANDNYAVNVVVP